MRTASQKFFAWQQTTFQTTNIKILLVEKCNKFNIAESEIETREIAQSLTRELFW